MTSNDEISRRALLRGRFLARPPDRMRNNGSSPDRGSSPLVMRYPTSTEEASPRRRRPLPIFRPPGAIDESTFLRECTRCEQCMEACPHEAIVHAPARFGDAAGTPMIDPDQQPCHMCPDTPCIAACEPDVLSESTAVLIGTAKVTEQTCLAHHGMTCTVCSEQCPVPGAIEVVAGKPRIVEDLCTGCGVCRHVCPSPENAILLMPTFHRPPRPTTGKGNVNA